MNTFSRRPAALLGCLILAHTPTYAAKLDSTLDAQSDKTVVAAVIKVAGRIDPAAFVLSDDAPLERRAAIVHAAQINAEDAQRDLRDTLAARGIDYRSYWIDNTIALETQVATLRELARRGDVVSILADRIPAPQAPPVAAHEHASPPSPNALPWNLVKINVPQVWAKGAFGKDVVVGVIDSGVKWDHEALKANYRGWNGSVADHSRNWHDAVDARAPPACPARSPVPCDLQDHGTGVTGVVAGSTAVEKIGVAPASKWIACRSHWDNVASPKRSRYVECLQWMLAPTDASGANPNPQYAPDIVNLSWYCESSMGCADIASLDDALSALKSAGIFVVAAANNDGNECGSLDLPPAASQRAYTVGSSGENDTMSAFSSRGPVPDKQYIKPDLVAPGENIRMPSARATPYKAAEGTSFAAPHVAGAAALLISGHPTLRGKPDEIAARFNRTAHPLQDAQTCGAIAPTTLPNYVQGHGRIDVLAAFNVP